MILQSDKQVAVSLTFQTWLVSNFLVTLVPYLRIRGQLTTMVERVNGSMLATSLSNSHHKSSFTHSAKRPNFEVFIK
jgi:hypothetical protein